MTVLLVAAIRCKTNEDGVKKFVPVAGHFNPQRDYDLNKKKDLRQLFADFNADFQQTDVGKAGWKIIGNVRFTELSQQYCGELTKLAKPYLPPNKRPQLTVVDGDRPG